MDDDNSSQGSTPGKEDALRDACALEKVRVAPRSGHSALEKVRAAPCSDQKTTRMKVNFKQDKGGLLSSDATCPLCASSNSRKKALRCDDCRKFFHLGCLKDDQAYQGLTWPFNNSLLTNAFQRGFQQENFICHHCEPTTLPLALQLFQQKFISKEELLSGCSTCRDYIDNQEFFEALEEISPNSSGIILEELLDVSSNNCAAKNGDNFRVLGSTLPDSSETSSIGVGLNNLFAQSLSETQKSNRSIPQGVQDHNIPKSMPTHNTDIPNISNSDLQKMIQTMSQMTQNQARLIDSLTSSLAEQSRLNSSQKKPNLFKKALPTLKIPTFSGDILQWNTFWQAFENAIDKQDFTNSEKMQFLLSCLEGEAATKVAGLMISEVNYLKAVHTLRSYYGQTDSILNAFTKKLFNLPPAYHKSENGQDSVISFFNEFNQIYNNICAIYENDLQKLAVQFSQVTYIVFCKLPRDLQEQLILTHGSVITTDINLFHSTLENIAKIKNRISPTYKTPTSSSQSFNNNSHTKSFNSVQKPSQPQEKNRLCVFCNKTDHYNDQCKTYPTATVRLQKLKENFNNRFCSNCLAPNHYLQVCRNRKECCYCRRNHNRALCFQRFPDTNSNANIASEFSTITLQSVESNGPITTLVASNAQTEKSTNLEPSDPEIIDLSKTNLNTVSPLQYVQAKIRNPSTKETISVNLLLDTGCECTYLKESIAEKLNLTKRGKTNLQVGTFGTNNLLPLQSYLVDFEIFTVDGKIVRLTANTNKHLATCQIKAIKLIDTDRFSINSLQVNQQQFSPKPRKIEMDIIIGNDYAWFFQIPSVPIELRSGCKLLNTRLGWMTAGILTNSVPDQSTAQLSHIIPPEKSNSVERCTKATVQSTYKNKDSPKYDYVLSNPENSSKKAAEPGQIIPQTRRIRVPEKFRNEISAPLKSKMRKKSRAAISASGAAAEMFFPCSNSARGINSNVYRGQCSPSIKYSTPPRSRYKTSLTALSLSGGSVSGN